MDEPDDYDSADSPLSSVVSQEEGDDVTEPRSTGRNLRIDPSVAQYSAAWPQPALSATAATDTPVQDEVEFASISSYTSGSVPNSPSAAVPNDEDHHHEQVTVCLWDGCSAGDLLDMDRLVAHIHRAHIEGGRQKDKGYTCEWVDCLRKGMPHASGYALKAHMRSHTREKPFYCALPECDRSFTRSDALAKHMRTVHETEALRPSDPVPKSQQPSNKGTRLKLILKQSSSENVSPGGDGDSMMIDENDPALDLLEPFQSDLFTETELTRGPKELYRLLRRRLHWAREESEALKRECEVVEAMRRQEWLDKEVLLDLVIKNEVDWHDRRRVVLANLEAATPAAEDATMAVTQETPAPGPIEEQAEAAAVLASLMNG